VEGGYEKRSRKKTCESCKRLSQHNVCRVRIDRFPAVMELRVEFGTEDLKDAVSWRDMSIPRYMTWMDIRYKFIGMIHQDSTKDREHFSSSIEIDSKLYDHLGDEEGFLRQSDATLEHEQAISLTSTIPSDSNIIPSRYYYLKDNTADGSGDWTSVKIERQPAVNTNIPSPVALSESSVGSDDELNISSEVEKMEVDDVRNGWALIT